MNWRPEQVLVLSECIIVWAGARAVLKLPVICCKRLLMSFRWAALGEAGGRKIEEKNSDFELYFVLCVFAYVLVSLLLTNHLCLVAHYFGVITSLPT